MEDALTMSVFDRVETAFAIQGRNLRTHTGRSVVEVTVDGKKHYLKRFWFVPSQLLKRQVARGLHETRMIDWLNESSFAAARIVRRGVERRYGFHTRMFFLMEHVHDEEPLETTLLRSPQTENELLDSLASFTASLHDNAFIHSDFFERHILIGSQGVTDGATPVFTFRLIDVERAHTGKIDHLRAASDLATLAASMSDDRLHERITTDFLDNYIHRRQTLPRSVDFRRLLTRTKPYRAGR